MRYVEAGEKTNTTPSIIAASAGHGRLVIMGDAARIGATKTECMEIFVTDMGCESYCNASWMMPDSKGLNVNIPKKE